MITKKYYAGIGARKTPENILELMSEISFKLEKQGFILRSGGANGADEAFEKGILNSTNKEIFLPIKGWRKNTSPFYNVNKEAYEIAKNYHPFYWKLKPFAKKCMARNSYQILGIDLNTPVEFVICWTKEGMNSNSDPKMYDGGTSQALRIAIDKNIPIYNLKNDNDLNLFLKKYSIIKKIKG